MSPLGVTLHQFTLYVWNGHIHLLKQHEQVIYKVGRFVDKAVTIAVNSLYHRLYSLLSHLLGYLLDTLDKELGGVGIFGHLGMTLLHESA